MIYTYLVVLLVNSLEKNLSKLTVYQFIQTIICVKLLTYSEEETNNKKELENYSTKPSQTKPQSETQRTYSLQVVIFVLLAYTLILNKAIRNPWVF